jgi:pimeloyl-ACP methyl ester carboxylesterase
MPHFAWNGRRLFYRERGQGPLLLVLPGNTASSACHEGELNHFSQRYRVASLDFLGTGRSDRVAVWADDWWEDGTRQAAALVSHLGHPDCVVMGTSGGAVIALLMAVAFPSMVRAVIADSFEERFTPEMLQQNVIADRAQRTPGQVSFWQGAHGPDWEQVVEADTEMLRRCAASGGDWFGERLPQVRCPVLLTASKGDTLLPDVALQLGRMAEQIPNCRAFLNNEGGHPLMWSRAQDFYAVADYFLSVVEERDVGAGD